MQKTVTIYPGQQIVKPTINELIKAGVMKRVSVTPTSYKQEDLAKILLEKIKKFCNPENLDKLPPIQCAALPGAHAMLKYIVNGDKEFFDTLGIDEGVLEQFGVPNFLKEKKEKRELEVVIQDTMEILLKMRYDENEKRRTYFYDSHQNTWKYFYKGGLAILCHIAYKPMDPGCLPCNFWATMNINENTGKKNA